MTSISGAATGAALATASGATIAIIIKYFQIVDILVNLISKINVRTGPKVGRAVKILSKMQMPTFKAAEDVSPIDDGGREAREKLEEDEKIYIERTNADYQEDDENGNRRRIRRDRLRR
jgi:hypothetical protein